MVAILNVRVWHTSYGLRYVKNRFPDQNLLEIDILHNFVAQIEVYFNFAGIHGGHLGF